MGDATATGTINDDDGSPTVSVSDAGATEGGAVEFRVSLSAASSRQVTVDYATSGGTATSGTDFTAASGSLTFGINETAKTVSVATTEDSMDENDETFTLTLSSPNNATMGDATATGTINDDDEPVPALTASFTGVPAEHDGSAAFTLRLQFSEPVGVSYAVLRDEALNATGGTVTDRSAREREQRAVGDRGRAVGSRRRDDLARRGRRLRNGRSGVHARGRSETALEQPLGNGGGSGN